MISEAQYNEQLPGLLSRMAKLSAIKSIQQSTTSFSSKDLIKGTSSPSHVNTPGHIQFMIRYNNNYTSPILYFKYFKPQYIIQDDMEIETSTSINKLEEIQSFLQIPSEFPISLGQCEDETWWFIHPCNTSDFLQNSEEQDYLNNWFSVYGGILFNVRVDEFYWVRLGVCWNLREGVLC